MTPLHVAVEEGSFEVVKYLVGKEAGSVINIRDASGVNIYDLLQSSTTDLHLSKSSNCSAVYFISLQT